jgi:hypothetical protein
VAAITLLRDQRPPVAATEEHAEHAPHAPQPAFSEAA